MRGSHGELRVALGTETCTAIDQKWGERKNSKCASKIAEQKELRLEKETSK